MSKPIQSPGAVLKLFLRAYQLNPTSLAKQLKLSQATVRLLTLDKTRISVHVALRLSKFFNMKNDYWLKLQNEYDLASAAGNAKINAVLKKIPVAKKPAVSRLNEQPEKPKAKAKTAASKGSKAGTASGRGRASGKKPAALS
jgi:addiction module HigA family antidote